METVFNQVLVFGVYLLLGFILKKKRFFSENTDAAFGDLVVFITLPSLIVSAMQFPFSQKLLLDSLLLLVISFSYYFLVTIFAEVVVKFFRLSRETAGVYKFILIFSNVGFMGYPLLHALYGKIGVFQAALYNIGFQVFNWTVGIALLRGESIKTIFSRDEIKKMFINPGIIAVTIGFSFFYFSVELPLFLGQALKEIGEVTMPLSMILVGSILGELSFKEILTDFKLWILAFIRLIVIPALTFAILFFTGNRGVMLAIPVILAAMPAAANTAIFANKYGGDAVKGAQGVFISTFLSLLTLLGWIYFLSYLKAI
ncbi:hypothetical protein ciss_02460 [Carboxydothermus islandicus]|uniref:Transporter n=1 Tax=Carboxydothermus islandicus TaxID=661089 RepID=A0A1L8CZJ6_9THEO|nr:AEC family transporter [Carboxydothermus islandicus]GAV24313.1 hypothetical protein ciss_02460 [Carboxydothermus islandicus]